MVANIKVPLDEQGVWVAVQDVEEHEFICVQIGWVEVLKKIIRPNGLVVLEVTKTGKRPNMLRLVSGYKVLVRDRIEKEIPPPIGGYELELLKALTKVTFHGIKYSEALYDAIVTTVSTEARARIVATFLHELMNLVDEKLADTFPVAMREMLRAYINECLKHVDYTGLAVQLVDLWGIG